MARQPDHRPPAPGARAPDAEGGSGQLRATDDVIADRPDEAVAPLGIVGILGTAVVGFGMGTADLVPGFSGGTVAFVAGIYERLIANVRQGARVLALLARGRVADSMRALAAVEWWFVLALLGGLLTAVFTLASVLTRLIDQQPTLSSAVLFGLVLGATVVSVRELRDPAPIHGIVILLVASVLFLLLGFSTGTVDDPPLWMMFGAGAVAICAMILPGLSGSMVLLMFGLYSAILSAVDQLDLIAIAVFGAGCVVGLASFSTLLNYLLRRYHDLVLATMIGLMLGSIRVLWPWPHAAEVGDPTLAAPDGDQIFLAAALALAAFALVWMIGLGLSALERRRKRQTAAAR